MGHFYLDMTETFLISRFCFLTRNDGGVLIVAPAESFELLFEELRACCLSVYLLRLFFRLVVALVAL